MATAGKVLERDFAYLCEMRNNEPTTPGRKETHHLPLEFRPTRTPAMAHSDTLVLVTQRAEFQTVADLATGLHPHTRVAAGQRVVGRNRFERHREIGLRYDPSDIAGCALAKGVSLA